MPSAGAGRSSRSTIPTTTSPSCSRVRRSRRRRSPPGFRRPRCDGRGRARSSATAAGCESGSTPGWTFTTRTRTSIRWTLGGWWPASTASTSQGAIGVDPWYTEPVGAERWSELVSALRARHAPFADELDALLPELVAMEAYVGGPPRELRTCHRDLWADNVRRTRRRQPLRVRLRQCRSGRPVPGARRDPRRVLRGSGARRSHPRRVRGGGRARARRGPDGLRDGDRAALAHPGRGLPALAGRHDRRRTRRQRGLGPRVRRPAVDPNRDRGAPCEGRSTRARSDPRRRERDRSGVPRHAGAAVRAARRSARLLRDAEGRDDQPGPELQRPRDRDGGGRGRSGSGRRA